MKALVLYHSQEAGNTAAMADAVAEGLRSAGAHVALHNTNDARFDVEEFAQYDCVAIGSPDYYSYVAGGLKMFLDDHHIASEIKGMPRLKDKPYALFYSHGGGGKVKKPLEDLFKRIGKKVGDTVESKGKPEGKVLETCKALGAQLAAAVRH
ncbi:MAG TPA: FprA family A-type flavoprotein [Planctomycetes bacterium]|nr:FprA family A-type flavoprotein [Planctomycetota bacterium]